MSVTVLKRSTLSQNKPVADSTSAMGFRFLKGFCLDLELVQKVLNIRFQITDAPSNFDVRNSLSYPAVVPESRK